MTNNYPIKKPSSASATGKQFYEFMINNLKIPASANHSIWYAGAEEQLKDPKTYAFRGDIPVGKTLELIALGGIPINGMHQFTGDESYVLVSDLAASARTELNISADARDKDKVFNSNFKPYDDLPNLTKVSNELAALSVPKSISSYMGGTLKKVNYSERDIMEFLTSALDNTSGPEMTHLLHGNHSVWYALAYIRENRNVSGDIAAEFYGQNPVDFYQKDMGTIVPSMFFALANLGVDPVMVYEKMDTVIWGADKVAKEMQKYMPKE
ncbi:MAG: hypothetical protein NDI94_03535 [Candidatus Woesearchaeota archaeon]|nr:hypothetical protein [Candidatus Woesearchaeota archaeon]